MGNFYTNITLRTTDRDAVANALRKNKRQTLVSEVVDGCIVVYDRKTEDQNQRDLEKLSETLSRALQCASLAVLNHDDDVLWYALHVDGSARDQYCSAPSFFSTSSQDQPPNGGDAAALRQVFASDADEGEIENILRSDRDDGAYTFEHQRHEALVQALGLPMISVACGYNYLEEGEYPEDTDESSFLRT